MNRPSTDQTLLNSFTIDNGGGFKDIFGQAEAIRYLGDFGKGKSKVSLRSVRDPDATLPLPKPVNLSLLPRRKPFSVNVTVVPVNHGGEAFVVNGKRERSANSGSLGALFVIESSPLRPSVREFGGDDKSTVHTNNLGALVVPHESSAPALRALPNP